MTTADAATPRAPLPLHVGVAAGGCATATAAVFTNPLEVVKSRMQVEAQLARHADRRYRHIPQALALIARQEGVAALQSGLRAAMAHQFVLNGVRLGTYSSMQRAIVGPAGSRSGRHPALYFVGNVAAGAAAGALGAAASSPINLVKIRLQTGELPRGDGLVGGFVRTVREQGLAALWRGVGASISRVAMGSAVQLGSYDQAKHLLVSSARLDPAATTTHLASSLLAGLCVTTAMQPADVVTTRMMNDSKGLYRNGIDCLARTFRAEGVRGLYRGFFPHYMRLGPHTVLTFILFERAKILLGYGAAQPAPARR